MPLVTQRSLILDEVRTLLRAAANLAGADEVESAVYRVTRASALLAHVETGGGIAGVVSDGIGRLRGYVAIEGSRERLFVPIPDHATAWAVGFRETTTGDSIRCEP